MAIIDVVKYEQQEGIIVHKFPSCDLRWGTQLVVYPGQVALLIKRQEKALNGLSRFQQQKDLPGKRVKRRRGTVFYSAQWKIF